MSRAHPSAVRNTAQVSCTVILWVCFFDFAILSNFNAQKVALHSLVTRLRKQYGIPADRVFGHRDFAPKACPCFDVHKEEW